MKTQTWELEAPCPRGRTHSQPSPSWPAASAVSRVEPGTKIFVSCHCEGNILSELTAIEEGRESRGNGILKTAIAGLPWKSSG